MSEGFGIVALLGALLGPAPPIQRPKSVPPPVQRPQEPASSQAEPQPLPPKPQPPPEPRPAPAPAPAATRSSPPLSDADRAAELEEFTENLEPLPPEPEPEPDPDPASPRRAPPRLDPADLVRRGFVISPAVGATLCGHEWCDSYRGGFGGQLELGFRFGTLMPHVSMDGGSGSDDTGVLEEQLRLPRDTIDSSRTTFFGVGGGLSLFFKRRGRLDPYTSARLGYTRTTSVFKVGNAQYKESVSRGSVRLGGGLDVFIGRNVSVGPRFDVTIGFAGRVCVEPGNAEGGPDGSSSQTCYDTRNIEDTARIYAQELPVPVFIGAQLRIIIPSPENRRGSSD